MGGFTIIGLNHNSASVEMRERFAPDAAQQAQLLEMLTAHTEECVVLATCNRTEFIYHATGEHAHAAIRALFLASGQLSEGDCGACFYTYDDEEALLHLYRVAASLDSMIPGETQITGQMKNAFDLAFRHGTIRGRFNRIYQHMLQTVKRVRNETGLGEGAVSVSSMAVQLAQHIYEDLSRKQVLLVGAGDMCELAAEHFQKAGVASIDVANRNVERAQTLACKVNGQAFGLDQLPSLLERYDIVLSSTASDRPIITTQVVQGAVSRRHGTPLLLIDISVPRDIEPAVSELPDVYLYNIDSLQQLVDRNLASRKREAEAAEQIVREQVQSFIQDENQSIGPLIRSLQERMQCIKAEQLEKLYLRDESLTQDQRQAINQSVDRIINKMLHDPLISLRRGIKEEERSPRNIVTLFKYFFNL